MVKSNSSRATKSIESEASREPSGSTATLAPTKPTFSAGFARLSASATCTSPANDGELVCSTARSCWLASGSTSSRRSPAAGASTSLLPGTTAATWASQVGYQNDLISRLAW